MASTARWIVAKGAAEVPAAPSLPFGATTNAGSAGGGAWSARATRIRRLLMGGLVPGDGGSLQAGSSGASGEEGGPPGAGRTRRPTGFLRGGPLLRLVATLTEALRDPSRDFRPNSGLERRLLGASGLFLEL